MHRPAFLSGSFFEVPSACFDFAGACLFKWSKSYLANAGTRSTYLSNFVLYSCFAQIPAFTACGGISPTRTGNSFCNFLGEVDFFACEKT